MGIFLTIVAVIVIFSVLVLIHELGHFLAAKRAGVKVLEFGFGFPPRLFSKKHGETTYSINAIPFGGFVRLYGEDSRDPEALKSHRSFLMKTPWVRTKIILAGVLMNFLLAYVLLVTGFTFGIQPLIIDEHDLFQNLEAGNIETRPGVVVKKVEEGSEAEKAGVQAGDELFRINGKLLTEAGFKLVSQLKKGDGSEELNLTFRRNGTHERSECGRASVELTNPDGCRGTVYDVSGTPGLQFSPTTNFPRPAIASFPEKGVLAKAGLQPGDILISVNGREVYTISDIISLFSQGSHFDISALRKGAVLTSTVDFPVKPGIYLSEILPGSAAEKAGFQSGDFLLKVGERDVKTPNEAQEAIQLSVGKPISFVLQREGKNLTIEAATNERNVLGISLTSVAFLHAEEALFYQTVVATSLTKIHNVSYSFPKALSVAWTEMGRLTKVTAAAFGRTMKGLFTKLEVPEDIGGPVQIAYYTHTFVKEGFFALLRFTALLSLSLAVINIIPFPALDGGRFLFVLVEVISGRRVNARFESIVHSLGFIFLLLLILLVTFSDISKIFA